VRNFTTLLGLAPVLFVVWFLLVSPASKLVLGNQLDAWRADDSFRPPIVFLQFDALPSLLLETSKRELDAVRYPNFAKLKRDGVWYRNASNLHENTVFAVPSFVDGRVPRKGTLPVVQDHTPNLFTLLGPGYRMNVGEEATTLCPYEFCRDRDVANGSLWKDTRTVFNQIIRPKRGREGLPSIKHRWEDFGAGPLQTSFKTRKKTPGYVIRHLRGGRIGRFQRWLANVGHGGERPELDYAHVFLPHEPREFLPDGKSYRTPNSALEGPPAYNNLFLSQQEEQRTILQLGFTDRVVGDVIAKLKRIGVYDDALIVVVADHGESFVPPKATPAGPFVPGHLGYRRAVTRRNLEDIASIPMFIKYPKGHGPADRIDDRFVRAVDVFPTIAHVLGLELPKLAGRDLRNPNYKGHPGVRVGTTFDGVIRRSAADWQRARELALRRRLRLFGSGKRSVYKFGAHADLVGLPLTDFEIVPAGSTTATSGGTTPVTVAPTTGGAAPTASAFGPPRATVFRAKAFEQVDPAAPICLCQVAGKIENTDPIGMPLAIALDDQIVATATGFKSRGGLNWAAMIPPTAYRDGRNELKVFRITGNRRLEQLGSAP
jgi:hypothetical protein